MELPFHVRIAIVLTITGLVLWFALPAPDTRWPIPPEAEPEQEWPPRYYLRLHEDGTCVRGFITNGLFIVDPPVLHSRKVEASIDPKFVLDFDPRGNLKIAWQQYPSADRPVGNGPHASSRPPGFSRARLWYPCGLYFNGYTDARGRFQPVDGQLRRAGFLRDGWPIARRPVTEWIWPPD